MADGAAAELQDDVVAEQVQQLVHLAGMDAAGRHRHHLAQAGPVLLEEQAALQVDFVVRLAQHVVEALHGQRIALQLADRRAGMDVVDAGQPHPLAITRNEMPWFFWRV